MDLSSNVKWGYQDNFNSSYFLFFFRKNFKRTKARHKLKSSNKTKKMNKKEQRQQFFLRTKTSDRVKMICFTFWCFFYAENFVIKKDKEAWNCSYSLKYYTTDVYLHQPRIICMHLILFVIIWKNVFVLWKSF